MSRSDQGCGPAPLLQTIRLELQRTNFSGRTVTLAEGALVVAGTSLLSLRARRGADTAVLTGIGALGLLDDLLEPRLRRADRPVSKGLRGHLGALRGGRLTTGALKALGIPFLALAGAACAPSPRGGAMVLADAALTAGCANLANLLDLRPGRALKIALPAAALLSVAPDGAESSRAATGQRLGRAALLPALIALPADLREHGMLGDAGANILGAAVGLAAARTAAPPARLGLLALVVVLNLASEKVSFSAVIDRKPVLRALDRLGRRPAPPAVPGTTFGATR